MAKCIIVKYKDRRPIYFPRLHFYPGGLTLPNDNNEIKVTEKEWSHLKLEKNGDKFCYRKVNNNIPKTSEEIKDGSR